MQRLESTHIDNFPKDVFLYYSPIKSGVSTEFLSEKELLEWKSFSNQHRKNEFLTARLLIHEAMSELSSPEDFELKKHPLGKPFILADGKQICVSLSHSKEFVFCAISPTTDIGLDTEWTERKVDPKIVKRILGEQEWNVFSDEDPVLLWTIKEAAVKCLGTGLRTNLKELQIKKNSENRFSVKINNEKTFQICSFRKLNHQISIAF